MSLKTMYITNNPQVALIAEKNGVDRVWIDLETLGKEERQPNMDTVKSKHSIEDIKNIAPLLTKSEMLVRINKWNENSNDEVEKVIEAGANIIMLPYWKTTLEVSEFIKAVNGRTKVILLLETKEAVECLDEVLKIKGIDEIHIGLNDLHLSYKLKFMFELLANGTVDQICNKIKKTNIPYGFGGIASLGTGDVQSEKIIIEHYRLGSTRVILSRSFCNTKLITDITDIEKTFGLNMKKFKNYEKWVIDNSNEKLFEKNHNEIIQSVKEVVNKMGGE